MTIITSHSEALLDRIEKITALKGQKIAPIPKKPKRDGVSEKEKTLKKAEEFWEEGHRRDFYRMKDNVPTVYEAFDKLIYEVPFSDNIWEKVSNLTYVGELIKFSHPEAFVMDAVCKELRALELTLNMFDSSWTAPVLSERKLKKALTQTKDEITYLKRKATTLRRLTEKNDVDPNIYYKKYGAELTAERYKYEIRPVRLDNFRNNIMVPMWPTIFCRCLKEDVHETLKKIKKKVEEKIIEMVEFKLTLPKFDNFY